MTRIFTYIAKCAIAILTLSLTINAANAQFFSVATSGIKTSTSYTIIVDKKNEYKNLRFASFDATSKTDKIILSWIPEQNIAGNYYEVEISADMNNFKTVAMILDGASFDGEGVVYKFKGDLPQLKDQNVAYYRIKQISSNNTLTYSNIIAVMLK